MNDESVLKLVWALNHLRANSGSPFVRSFSSDIIKLLVSVSSWAKEGINRIEPIKLGSIRIMHLKCLLYYKHSVNIINICTYIKTPVLDSPLMDFLSCGVCMFNE
jgi:hypothetical protein